MSKLSLLLLVFASLEFSHSFEYESVQGESGFTLSVPRSIYKIIDIPRVKKISYILASAKGIGSSSFGHSYLRFSYGDEYSHFDPTIEFVANTPQEEIDIFRGMGIGENYDIIAKNVTYKFVYYENAILANRDLTSYELNLNQEQIEAIAKKVNELIVFGNENQYTYFYTNCARIISETLNDVLKDEEDIYGLSAITPILLPKSLKADLLVRKIVIDERATKKKMELFDKYFPRNISEKIIDDSQKERIKKGVNHQRIVRKSTYMQLAALSQNELISKKNRSKIRKLGKKLLFKEIESLKNEAKFYFRKNAPKVHFVEVLGPRAVTLGEASLASALFKNEGETVYIQYEVTDDDTADAEESSFYYQDVESLKYRDGAFFHKGMLIGRSLDLKISPENFFSRNTTVLHRIDSNGRPYSQITFISPEKNHRTSFNIKKDRLSIGNGYKGIPMCYSVAELQKRLLERVIFSPKDKPLSMLENQKLILELYNGKFIVVPGFSNIYAFTSSLDQDWLAQIIKSRQLRYYSWFDNAKQWFTQVEINSKNINTLKSLVKMGHYTILNFKTRKTYINIGHAILVYGIEEDEDYYHVKAYDPNFDILKNKILKTVSNMGADLNLKARKIYAQIEAEKQADFKINKKTMKLESSLYGKSPISFFRFSAMRNDLFLKTTKGTSPRDITLTNALIRSSNRLNKYAFYLHEIMK